MLFSRGWPGPRIQLAVGPWGRMGGGGVVVGVRGCRFLSQCENCIIVEAPNDPVGFS